MLRRRASGRLRFKRPRRGLHRRTRRQRHELHPRARPGHLQLAQHRLRRPAAASWRMAQREFRQIYPQPGWVEHDPREIWASPAAPRRARRWPRPASKRADIAAIGITNQRETTLLWNRAHRPAGAQRHRLAGPAHRAAVRAAARRRAWSRLIQRAHRPASSTPTSPAPSCAGCSTTCPARAPRRARRARLRHRRQLAAVAADRRARARHRRDQRLAHAALRHPPQRLGRRAAEALLRRARQRAAAGASRRATCTARPTPRCSARRSRSPASPATSRRALFGQACFTPGLAKNTYGTGCFMLMHTGERVPDVGQRPAHHAPPRRLGTTPAVRDGRQRVHRRRRGAVAARRAARHRGQQRGAGAGRERARQRRRDRSCRPSPGWARRTGSPMRAAPSSGLTPRHARWRTSRAPRWRASPSRARRCCRR